VGACRPCSPSLQSVPPGFEDLSDVTFLIQHFRLTEADLKESFDRLPARFKADPVVQDNLRFVVEDLL